MLHPTWFSHLASTIPALLQSCRFSHLAPILPALLRTHQVLPSGTHRATTAPDPPASPVRYPPSQHCSGPARFSSPVPAVLPPLPSAAGDALRMRAWLFTHLCPCCITWLHRDVASNNGLAGCWKSPPPSASRLLELLGACPSGLERGLEQRALLPNRSVLARLIRHRVLESIPGAWHVTRTEPDWGHCPRSSSTCSVTLRLLFAF